MSHPSENLAMQFILLIFFLISGCVTQILVTRYDDNKIPIEDTNNIGFDPDIYLSAVSIVHHYYVHNYYRIPILTIFNLSFNSVTLL